MTERPRFVLVDPSFDGTAGDKWQYAVTFAKSASRNGYDFVLLAGVDSPLIADHVGVPVDQRNVFKYTFYDHAKIVSRQSGTGEALDRRRRNASLARRLADVEEAIAWSSDRGERDVVEALNREKRLLLLRSSRNTRGADTSPAARPFNEDDFASALAEECRRLKLRAGDKLFFHTMTQGMMESLAEVSLRLEMEQTLDVDAYFLFHFGKDAPDAKTFVDRYHSFSAMGSLAARLRVGLPFRRLHLLATNEALARELNDEFGLPVQTFDGLTDLESYEEALGGRGATEARRDDLRAELSSGTFRVVVRAGDVVPGLFGALRKAEALLDSFGIGLHLRLSYHDGSIERVRALMPEIEGLRVELAYVQENAAYIRSLGTAHLALLTYPRERYEKRVSAVLHDCSVLGVACLVPSRTTLADARGFASLAVYDDIDDIPGLLLRVARSRSLGASNDQMTLVAEARRRYASDVVPRLIHSSSVPSLEVAKVGERAAVVMPAWGRCGSSFAMEAQVRYLLDRGFFVLQVFLLDKHASTERATPFFWSLLRQNSVHTRGCVQRVAYASFAEVETLRKSEDYLRLSAFDQFAERIAAARTQDDAFEVALKRACVTVVNHVFHYRFAQRHCGGAKVLETHDIQSFQMQHWNLLNDRTQSKDRLADLVGAEFRAVGTFDHVVNVAPEEHLLLSSANPRASLITPYIPETPAPAHRNTPDSVASFARETELHECYQALDRFDLFLAGDSHIANVESACWFVREVFQPHLAVRGFSLAVVGRLSDALHARIGAVPYVYYVGFVDDLSRVRRLSRVVVLPDRRGTGISIKTLEAFASGMPFVATSVALRGLRARLPKDFNSFDEPADFAAEVLELLGHPDAAKQSSERAREAYRLLASGPRFDRAWDRVLQNLGFASPNLASHPSPGSSRSGDVAVGDVHVVD